MTAGAVVNYAGFWRRAAALAMDVVLFFGVVGLLNPFQLYGYQNPLFYLVLGAAYCVIAWRYFAGTPGKLLMGCQVVDAATLEPPGIGRSLIRFVAYYASQLVFCLGFFWVLFDTKKQGFHDKIAQTVVLQRTEHWHDDESQKTLSQLIGELR